MKILKYVFVHIFVIITFAADAHVPFLKPNQFILQHNRLQIESSYTEFPFQADFATKTRVFSLIRSNGTQTKIVPGARTRAAEYLEPVLNESGTYRINLGFQKGPKYSAIETTEGKLYFADDTLKKQGEKTTLQYYDSADTYILLGQPDYKPQLLNKGVEIIPLSSPNSIKVDDEIFFRVYLNGNPVANARVVVVYNNEHYEKKRLEDLYDVENSRKSNIQANNEGIFSFIPQKAGLVLLFVNIHKKANDSLWESYNSSLTLEVNLAL